MTVSGIASSTKAPRTFPLATIDIFYTGTLTRVPIFSTSTGTVKANAFTADSFAVYDFFVAPGTVFDVRITPAGGTPSQFTRSGYTAPGTPGTSLALCGGTADTSLLSALSALGGTIEIPKGVTCASNTQTISATMKIDKGGLLKPLNSQTLTLTGYPDIGIYPAFTNTGAGQGTILFRASPVTGDGMTQVPQAYPQWWQVDNAHKCVADYATDCQPAIQSAINSGARRIFLVGGGYGLGAPVVITNINFMLEGQSRVYTDIFALTADIHVGSGPNAMFVNSVNGAGSVGPNSIFKSIRFLSVGVNFTGWVFWAEEGVQGGKDMFSSTFEDLWIALGGSALGFFHGGMSDCFVTGLDIELTTTVFELKGVGVSTNTFTNSHMLSCRGPFISSLDTMSTVSITAATNADPVVFTASSSPGSSSVPNVPVIISGLTGSMGAKLNGFHVATRLSATTFSVPINTTALSAFGGTATWRDPSSTQIQISNIAASNQLSYILLEAKNGVDWQINNVSVEYNGGGTVAGGLASFDTMSKVLMTNFTARRLSGGMSGIAIKNSQVKLNTGYIFNPQSSSFASAGIDISSTATATLPRLVDVDVNNVTLESGAASVPQVNISADGSVRVRNSRFHKSAYYAIVATMPSAADITISNNEILNSNYNVASVVPILAMETSGRFECDDNTIGVNDALAVPTANFSFTGAGTAKVNGNTFVGSLAMCGGGSTQAIFTTLFDSAALPTTCAWQRGSIITNSLPAEAGGGGSKYIIGSWSRITTGTGNTLNTDWFQMRTLTGN